MKSTRVLVVSTTLLVSVLLAVVAFMIVNERRQILAASERRAESLAQVIDEQTGGTLTAIDAVLSSATLGLRMLPDSRRPAQINQLLREHVSRLPFVWALALLDARGTMVNNSENLPRRSLAHREYFSAHRDRAGLGLFIEEPKLSVQGIPFISVSQRLNRADGAFAGVIAAGLRPQYLQQVYGRVDVGASGVVALFKSDGTLLVRDPKPGLPPRFQPAGTHRAVDADSVPRIYAFRKVKDLPLVVAVGLGEDEILAGWRTLAISYLLASCAFVLVISWLTWFAVRELRRREAQAVRLRELSQRVIETQETERRHINNELHDRIGQNLSTLNLNLNLALSQVPAEAPQSLGRLIAGAQSLLEGTILQVRNVMRDLHPPALDDLGLLAALRVHAEAFQHRTGTPVEVRGDEDLPQLTSQEEMVLFRIAQEALTNAAKHAGARKVGISLTNGANRATLTVSDDGVGFDAGRARPASWGLTIMRERADAAGIHLRVESRRGHGTRVVAEVPA